jgi:hypothetical protein
MMVSVAKSVRGSSNSMGNSRIILRRLCEPATTRAASDTTARLRPPRASAEHPRMMQSGFERYRQNAGSAASI